MKILTGTVQSSSVAGPGQAAETAPIEAVAPAASSTHTQIAHGEGTLQSAVMQPALAALREMPDIDHAKVAALRDALAKGEIPFNASKLAGLIERFHRSKS